MHLSSVCNESMGGRRCGGCVNLAVVPNESRSYFETLYSEPLSLRSCYHVASLEMCFESPCFFRAAPAVQQNILSLVQHRL